MQMLGRGRVREGVRSTGDVAEVVAIDTAEDIAGSRLLWTVSWATLFETEI